ncbi:response regulator [Paenibacillus filicis]|uniref:Response regulator n=1 Tax=Paenibacillus gyeongsangnamensis TaxID=3388067 RepID=A0ABT4QAD4_9BACL|nr:response regulator [Paenibacillus filicis]MCZ8513712.1 response regulator [Paenibacillus filicis]
MNILVVEDEEQIRRWFDLLIRKTNVDMSIAGVCGNGREALEICRNQPVELVITDIKMPVMDGLELIKRLKTEFPSVRTLILSSYGEFHFASEALKLGASDYILKAEVTVEGLRETLQKVKSEIELERKRNQEMYLLKSALNENQYALRSIYFSDLLKGLPSAVQEFENKMNTLRVPLKKEHLTIMIVSIDDYRNALQTSKIRTKELLDMAVINIIDETLQNEAGNGCGFLYDRNLYVVLVNTYRIGDKSVRESTLQYAHRISNHLNDFLGVSASIGISLPYNDLSMFGKQYEEAYEALSQKQFFGRRSIVWFQDVHNMYLKVNDMDLHSILSGLSHYLERGDFRHVEMSVLNIIDEIEKHMHVSEKDVKTLSLEIVFLLLQKIRELQAGINDVKGVLDAGLPHEEVMQLTSFWEVKSWLTGKVCQLLEAIAALRPLYSEPIRKACEFMCTAYAEDISLQQVADLVHLNKTYLSELFKKETGVSFNDYLTKVRIDKSKELILSGGKISTLAEQVGYPNGSYFTKVFKKVMGMTPMDFKQAGGGTQN